MRRALASLLLAVLGLLLITPLLLADTRSELPACCRRDGKHHCATAAMNTASVNGPGFAATAPKCPLFPKAVPVAQGIQIYLVPSRRSFEHVVRTSGIAVRENTRRCYSTRRNGRERSPPLFTLFS